MSEPVKQMVECLLEGDWTGWRIEKVVEVYNTNDDGQRTSVVGYFRDQTIAWAFVMEDAGNHRKSKLVSIFTNGIRAYILGDPQDVKFFDEKAESTRLKKRALAKLTESEKELLGLA
ncbi:MAG TPA: hypothetical protein PLV72_02875 [Candidatus Magasanikbacteria bacterium]|nr:hypothetical protein [Candidatus Magasanikbacteria bacterium]